MTSKHVEFIRTLENILNPFSNERKALEDFGGIWHMHDDERDLDACENTLKLYLAVHVSWITWDTLLEMYNSSSVDGLRPVMEKFLDEHMFRKSEHLSRDEAHRAVIGLLRHHRFMY